MSSSPWTCPGRVSGTATFTSPAVLTDAGLEITGQIPVTTSFQAGSLPSMSLLSHGQLGAAAVPVDVERQLLRDHATPRSCRPQRPT